MGSQSGLCISLHSTAQSPHFHTHSLQHSDALRSDAPIKTSGARRNAPGGMSSVSALDAKSAGRPSFPGLLFCFDRVSEENIPVPFKRYEGDRLAC